MVAGEGNACCTKQVSGSIAAADTAACRAVVDRMQGLDLATYFKYTGMTLENLKEQLRPQAEKQVKVRLALEKIAKLEKLTVSAKEIEAEYKRIAEAYNMPLEQVKELIAKDSIAADMKVKAAIELVKEKAIVK